MKNGGWALVLALTLGMSVGVGFSIDTARAATTHKMGMAGSEYSPKMIKAKVGDKVELVGLRDTRDTVITGVEMFRKQMDECMAGDNVGLLLRGVEKEDLERGMCLVAPKSVTPHKKFKGSVYILSKEEGGRHTPFFNGYRPQFYFRTTDVTGVATLPEGREMVMPGDNVDMVVELITPIAMEKELRFAIREGGRTVGAGVVTEIVE